MARLKFSIQRPWIPIFIFSLTFALTLLSTFYANRTIYTEDKIRFVNETQNVNIAVENRLDTYMTLIRGVAGLYSSNPTITQDQFNAYIGRLRISKYYPGTQGIGFIQKVDADQLDSFIQNIQTQENSSFTVTPPGNRPTYFVIRYLAVPNGNTPKIIGFDMSTDKIRFAAMQYARDNGKTTTTQKLTLWNAKNTSSSAGFLMFTPVYSNGGVPATVTERRKELVGFMYGIFSVNEIFNNIIANSNSKPELNFQMYAGNSSNANNLLLAENTYGRTTNFQPRFQETKIITEGGQVWTIKFTNNPEFENESQKNLALFIFFGGTFISIMFFMLSRSQYAATMQASKVANDLMVSQNELKKAVGMRDSFISIASHELKTPVTSLKAYAEILLRMNKNSQKTTTFDYLTKMLTQIDKLTLLIQDLLDVSRIQSNQLTYRIEKFDLNIMIKEIVENTQQIADHHRIVVEGKVTKKVWGDRDRISQVLINLLTNAMKYASNSNKIIVSIKDGGTGAIVSVQDFGMGISREHQKRIFNRFYRVSDTKEHTFPGLGIGLFISSAIVKRHGGKIQVSSKKGEGSIFKFSVPYDKKAISGA